MRYFFIIIISLLSLNVSNAQSKSDLQKEVSSLKMEIKKLNLYISDLERQIDSLQNSRNFTNEIIASDTTAVNLYQCKAITLSGKRCSIRQNRVLIIAGSINKKVKYMNPLPLHLQAERFIQVQGVVNITSIQTGKKFI